MKSALVRWGGLIAAGALAAALVVGLRVPQNVHALREKHQRIRQLQIENADLVKDLEARRKRIRDLRENRSQQELELRRERKMLREDEKSVVTPGEPAEPSPR
jgi:septal ring factor EnvC (AmiA/AmiB activator)